MEYDALSLACAWAQERWPWYSPGDLLRHLDVMLCWSRFGQEDFEVMAFERTMVRAWGKPKTYVLH
jgi:hypothetical protein